MYARVLCTGPNRRDQATVPDQRIHQDGGHATAQSTNGDALDVFYGGSVGNDDIQTGGYNSEYGSGDMVAGDSMARSGGDAYAYGENIAWNATKAGDDYVIRNEEGDPIEAEQLQ